MNRVRLRTKFLILFSAIALVPLVLTLWLTYARFQKTLEGEAIKLENQLATTASNKVKTFIISQVGVLNTIATLFDQEFSNPKASSLKIIENILYKSDNFTDISIVDKDGQEIIKEDRTQVFLDSDLHNIKNTEAFLSVETKGLYVGKMYIENGKPLFDLGRWIVDPQGNFSGAVFAKVDAKVIPGVMANISKIAGNGGQVFMVNEHGIVIAHSDLSYILSEKDLSDLPLIKETVMNKNSTTTSGKYFNEKGIAVLGSVYPIILEPTEIRLPQELETNWFVVVEQQQDVVFDEAYRVIWFFIFVSLGVLLLVSTSAIYFAKKISAPVESLYVATKEFTKGNLEYRTKISTNDEIGDLAKNFDEMAITIDNSIKNLKQEEKIILAEKDKLSVILSGITNAVIAVDFDRKIILFNKSAEKLIGLTTEEAIGKNITELLTIFDTERELSTEEYCRVKPKMLGEKEVFHGNNLKLINTKKQEYYVNLTSGTIDEKSSINLGCILTFTDITRELQMEKTKGEFVTIAAHQLRTPLTGLKWSLDFIFSGETGALNPDQKQMIEKAAATTNHMIELVNDLLNISQIEEGRFGINLKQQSIVPILENIKNATENIREKNNIKLQIDELPLNMPLLNLDKEKMEMAIENVMDNSIKYSHPDGTVELKVVLNEHDLLITIKDFGIGISADESQRIFTKFFRSSRALLHETTGTGLGLHVSKNIIEQHGGKIWFESKENEGTTFFISLPLST